MKRVPALVLILIPWTAPAQEEMPFPPVAYPLERYAAMMQRSPFVLPSFDEATQVQENWTADFRIVSVLRLGENSVVLARKLSTDERIAIRAEDNHLGIRLVKLELSADPHDVSAVIEMGGEEGTIRYDDAILSQIPRAVAPNNPAVIPE